MLVERIFGFLGAIWLTEFSDFGIRLDWIFIFGGGIYIFLLCGRDGSSHSKWERRRPIFATGIFIPATNHGTVKCGILMC